MIEQIFVLPKLELAHQSKHFLEILVVPLLLYNLYDVENFDQRMGAMHHNILTSACNAKQPVTGRNTQLTETETKRERERGQKSRQTKIRQRE